MIISYELWYFYESYVFYFLWFFNAMIFHVKKIFPVYCLEISTNK